MKTKNMRELEKMWAKKAVEQSNPQQKSGAHTHCHDLNVALRAAITIAALMLSMKMLKHVDGIWQVQFVPLAPVSNVAARFKQRSSLPVFFLQLRGDVALELGKYRIQLG